MGNEICLIKIFFQIYSFVFSRTNKHIEVWNNMRVSNILREFSFLGELTH